MKIGKKKRKKKGNSNEIGAGGRVNKFVQVMKMTWLFGFANTL